MAPLHFTGSGLERLSSVRPHPASLAAAFAEPGAGFVLIWQARCLLSAGGQPVCGREVLEPLGATPPLSQAGAVFLGRRAGRPLFAIELPGNAPPARLLPEDFRPLRDVLGVVGSSDGALLAYARAMLLWHTRHRHCGVCGAPNRSTEGGFVLACTRDGCGHKSFPRIDPAVIVLVHRGDRCLLGRQSTWPEGRFSTLAGFAEPGESLEETVRREVREESNIEVGECTYLGSQPWPFPAALMLGFHGVGLTEEIRCNDGELAEARWVTREALQSGQVRLPSPASIAFQLIATWHDREGHPPLASLGHSARQFVPPAPGSGSGA